MSKRVYGIDLGTTYSCISYVDEHGKPVVVPNSEGQLTTPSVVWFESPDNVVVGRTAKDVAAIHPDRVVSTIKRRMGDVNFALTIDGHSHSPQEISSYILRKLVKDAATVTGDTITDVVITCPAYFGVTQKEATKQAGTLAGLNVLYVIPEPTAAAIAYGLEQSNDQNVLVYDLGGGTFDTTVISISKGEIAVIATGGDDKLGGKDWDDDLVGHLAHAFEAQTGTPAEQLLDDRETYQELLRDSEELKVKLTSAKSVPARIRHESGSARLEVTRDAFNELTSARLERTVSLTEEMLAQARQSGITKIDKLLLVGGSTYMPQVVERLSKYPFEVVQFDPNQAVAKGAALFGYRCALDQAIKIRIAERTGQAVESIEPAQVPQAVREFAQREVAVSEGLALPALKKLVDTKITNVTAKSFGLIVLDESAGRKEMVSNLVVINEQVPRDVSRPFFTIDNDQLDVELRVMQNQQRTSENQLIDLALCEPTEPIGTAVLTFARPMPKRSRIEVTFRLGPDGCLSLHGRDLTSGREVHAEFRTAAVMSSEELAEAQKRVGAVSVS